MKYSACSQQDAVTTAVASGNWPERLAAHAESCAICREIVQSGRWVQALASSVEKEDAVLASRQNDPLPDPGLVWQRAQLEVPPTGKLATLLEFLQTGIAAAVPIGLAAWVAWNWYAIEALAGQFLLASWPQFSGALIYALARLAPAALMSAALALGYPLVSDE